MKRSDLESKVQITWEPGENVNGEQVPFDRCCGHVEFRSSGYFSRDLVGPGQRDEMERAVRESMVRYLIGDLEAENQRLRAAVDKWSRRAMAGSMSRQIEPDQWTNELKEDLNGAEGPGISS